MVRVAIVTVAHCETKAFSEVRVAATVDVLLVVDLGMCPCVTPPAQYVSVSFYALSQSSSDVQPPYLSSSPLATL